LKASRIGYGEKLPFTQFSTPSKLFLVKLIRHNNANAQNISICETGSKDFTAQFAASACNKTNGFKEMKRAHRFIENADM
jgi:hypothetical protein